MVTSGAGSEKQYDTDLFQKTIFSPNCICRDVVAVDVIRPAEPSPGGFAKTTPPISAACQGCHDDKATASHALANTTALGESCTACHSAGEEFSVDRVHQRIF